jgi:hypothetical protein
MERFGLATKARLAAEILGTYIRARWLLWRRPLPEAVAALRCLSGTAADEQWQATGIRLGRAVGKTLARLPFDSRCLVSSLVLTSMLARRGIDSRLVIGVGVEPSFSAHAWVECGGSPLLRPLDDANRLVEL